MAELVGNPEDMLFRVAAHILGQNNLVNDSAYL